MSIDAQATEAIARLVPAQPDSLRIVQVSDLHLSGERAFHQDNWEIVLEWLDAERPDLVVVSGDVALSDPDRADDLAFARRQVDRIPVPWLAIPGNHDIGDNLVSGAMKQRVTPERLARWHEHFGRDHWCLSVAGWVLLGVNAQILNAPGLEAEDEQARALAAALEAMEPQMPLALFVHKPLFVDHPSETAVSQDCLDPEARRRLMALVAGRNLKLVACGHKHQYRAFGHDGVAHVWAPSTACVNFPPGARMWGERQVGFIDYRLTRGRVRHRVIGADFLMRHESYIRQLEYGSALAAPAEPVS